MKRSMAYREICDFASQMNLVAELGLYSLSTLSKILDLHLQLHNLEVPAGCVSSTHSVNVSDTRKWQEYSRPWCGPGTRPQELLGWLYPSLLFVETTLPIHEIRVTSKQSDSWNCPNQGPCKATLESELCGWGDFTVQCSRRMSCPYTCVCLAAENAESKKARGREKRKEPLGRSGNGQKSVCVCYSSVWTAPKIPVCIINVCSDKSFE